MILNPKPMSWIVHMACQEIGRQWILGQPKIKNQVVM